jgi:hypothetical protein
MKLNTSCLSQADFDFDWDQWISIVDQATKTTEKIGFPDKTLEIDSAKVNGFITDRLLVESHEKSLIKDLWTIATPGERKIMGELLFKIMDESAQDVRKQSPDEPYGGY